MEDTVLEPVNESELQGDESVLLSMDNIVMDQGGLNPDEVVFSDSDSSEASENNDESKSENDSDIPEAIENLLQPLKGNVTGEDPRYSDEFVLMKVEIDKLTLNDYNAILTLAREVLSAQGKDLRVAGYFMLANTYINGITGLIDGLVLYQQLLERFGDALFPAKETARDSALQWLNNNKLLAYVRLHQSELNAQRVDEITQRISLLNENIVATTNDDTLCLNSLNDWLKEARKTYSEKPVQNTSRQTNDVQRAPSGATNTFSVSESLAGQSQSENSGGFDLSLGSALSESELYSFTRKIVKQLMTDKLYARGIAYARAARWGGMSMPPNESGKTRLTPPRQTGVNQITSLLAAGDYEAALTLCEGIFFEMGGHILLDLQMYAHRAAKGLGQNDIANLVACETAAFLQRFPGIEQLRFDDDTPCANGECLTWLDKIAAGGKSSMPLFNSGEEDKALLDGIEQAIELAEQKDLTTGLMTMDRLPAKNTRQRFQLQLAMSQLCLDHGRAELALPMLDDLHEQSTRYSLAMWDVGLAMSVAKQLQNALRAVVSTAAEENRAQYEQRLESVAAQMCRWDLAQASQYL